MLAINEIQIKYDVTLDETEKGFKQFQKKFMLKRKIIYTAVYAIVVGLGVDLIVKNYTSLIGYIAVALGLALICVQWIRPYLVRKKMLTTLSGLNEERYITTLYQDRIEVETDIIESEDVETVAVTRMGIIPVEEGSQAAKELEDIEPEAVKSEKSVYEIAHTELCSEELEDMFLLYVNRSLIYIYPKRCLTEEQIKAVREYFDDKDI